MQSEKDLDDYFCSLLDTTVLVHKQFLIDLKKRYRLCKFTFTFIIIIIKYQ